MRLCTVAFPIEYALIYQHEHWLKPTLAFCTEITRFPQTNNSCQSVPRALGSELEDHKPGVSLETASVCRMAEARNHHARAEDRNAQRCKP